MHNDTKSYNERAENFPDKDLTEGSFLRGRKGKEVEDRKFIIKQIEQLTNGQATIDVTDQNTGEFKIKIKNNADKDNPGIQLLQAMLQESKKPNKKISFEMSDGGKDFYTSTRYENEDNLFNGVGTKARIIIDKADIKNEFLLKNVKTGKDEVGRTPFFGTVFHEIRHAYAASKGEALTGKAFYNYNGTYEVLTYDEAATVGMGKDNIGIPLFLPKKNTTSKEYFRIGNQSKQWSENELYEYLKLPIRKIEYTPRNCRKEACEDGF